MAETYTLSAKKREVTKNSARETRAENRVPGVLYGHGVDSVTLSVDYSDILRTYRKAGTSSIIDLDLDGKKMKVLVHDLNLHPVRDEIHHVDFYVVNMKEATTVSVPLVFVGESPAVKTLGGILVRDHDHLSIRCLPSDIPHEIEVDISSLETNHDHISIKDLNLDPEKFELMGLDEGSTICSVTVKSGAEEPETPETESEAGSDGDQGEAEGDKKEEKSEE